MMVIFKKRSNLKQCIGSKPTKRGYKIWVRSGVSGHVYDFKPYQGSSGCNKTPKGGLGCDVVIYLCRGLEKKNLKVCFDNFFTSIILIETLKQ